MSSHTISKRTFVALATCYHIWGCTGATAPASLSIAQANAQTQTLREAFDPRSIKEDFLLIRPNFALPQLQLAQSQPDVSPTPQAVEKSVEVDSIEQTASEQAATRNTTVYRVQLLALSNGDLAQQLRDELTVSLSVPMYVQERNQLYVIQGGDYATRGEARYLLNRVKALSSDYGDAYVVSVESQFEAPEEIVEDRPVASSEDVPNSDANTQPGELVRTFGWRVLLDQFLSHEEADRLRNRAITRLNRRDVDITFKAPWYKVEVGHFSEENEAQSAAEQIKRRYPNALKVRSQVLIPRPN